MSENAEDSDPSGERGWAWRIFSSTLARGAAVGVVVGTLVALADGTFALRQPGAGAGVLLLALCLHLPAGLVVGMLVGAFAGGIEVGFAGRDLLRRLRQQALFDRALAAALVALALVFLLEVGLVYLFARRVAAGMANPHLAALSTALWATFGLLIATLVVLPAWPLLGRLCALLPRSSKWPATATVVAAGVVALLFGGLIILGNLDWRALQLGRWLMLGAMLLIVAVVTVLLRQRGRRKAIGLLTAAVLGAGGAGVSAPAIGRDAGVVAAAQEGGVLLPSLVTIARWLGDHDGDGFSSWFNGGDCDDGNPAINPGARDLPGNGVDENCQGGDARIVARSARRRVGSGAQSSFDGSLLLVCIDTLRADVLGAMGHPGGLTPTLDRLAADGTLFRNAYAQAPNTPQSFPSIFTSLYPERVPYRSRFAGYPALAQSASTIFEELQQAGIALAAVTSHFYFTTERGIIQGVADWDNRGAKSLRESNKDVASPRIVPRALEKLAQLAAQRRRFVLFVHLFEPHSTYVKHAEFPVRQRGLAGLRQKYDFEVKFADMWLGRLLEGIPPTLRGRLAVGVFSDHGEAFGEHRLFFHGQALYEEVLRVPMILTVPGFPARVVDQRVALLDLGPTILELFGVKIPEQFQGISLVDLLHRGEPLPPRDIGASLMPYPAWPMGQRVRIAERYKTLLRTSENRLEIYDLENDPGERHNLAVTQKKLAERLRGELVSFVEQEMQ